MLDEYKNQQKEHLLKAKAARAHTFLIKVSSRHK